MSTRTFARIAGAAGSLIVGLAAGWSPQRALAQAPATRNVLARTLMGTVLGPNGKPMEGVAVSGRGVDQTFTTIVYTDEKGNYFFPALDGGRYRVGAQAVGYKPARSEVMLDAGKEMRQDFTLKILEDFSSQLSGTEWLLALPLDTPENRRMKEILQHDCTYCHSPSFVLQNKFDKAGWTAIVNAMERATQNGNWQREPLPHITHFKGELIEYLTKVRGSGPTLLKFKPLPRPMGNATHVVITEFDTSLADAPDQPNILDGSDWSDGSPSASAFRIRGSHDAAVDFAGNGWVSSSGGSPYRSYAKIDGKTGKVTNFVIPGKNGVTRGTYEITVAPDGMIWMNLMSGGNQGGGGSLARVDPQTGKMDIYDPPPGMASVGNYVDVDGKGKVWAGTRRGAVRLDPDTMIFTEFVSAGASNPKLRANGFAADADGNGWWAEFKEGDVLSMMGASDVKTGKSRQVPVTPHPKPEVTTDEDRKAYFQTPHRLAGDHRGSTIWAGDFFGEDIAGLDIRTGKVSHFGAPVRDGGVYDVAVDANHIVWVLLRDGDRVGRFDPATKKWTVYALPTLGAECRNIFADEYGQSREVWLASWRTSKAIRLQFPTDKDWGAVRARK